MGTLSIKHRGRAMKKIDRMYQYFGHGEGTCKDCSNLVTYEQSRKWYKCAVYGLSSSEATDFRLKWGACGMKNKDPTGITPIVKLGDSIKREEEQCNGQMSLFDSMTV